MLVTLQGAVRGALWVVVHACRPAGVRSRPPQGVLAGEHRMPLVATSRHK